jgi:hypothetical protein
LTVASQPYKKQTQRWNCHVCRQNNKLQVAAEAAAQVWRAKEAARSREAESDRSAAVSTFSAAAAAACQAADAKVDAMHSESLQHLATAQQEALDAVRAVRQERQACAQLVCVALSVLQVRPTQRQQSIS